MSLLVVATHQGFQLLQDTSAGGGKALVTGSQAQGKMLLTETAEPSDDAIILPTSSVDITDVSRMGFDLRRKASVGNRNKVDPEDADKRFVKLLVQLLEKVRYLGSCLFYSVLSTCQCSCSTVIAYRHWYGFIVGRICAALIHIMVVAMLTAHTGVKISLLDGILNQGEAYLVPTWLV